jgi:hypothetical protein
VVFVPAVRLDVLVDGREAAYLLNPAVNPLSSCRRPTT